MANTLLYLFVFLQEFQTKPDFTFLLLIQGENLLVLNKDFHSDLKMSCLKVSTWAGEGCLGGQVLALKARGPKCDSQNPCKENEVC